MKGGQVEPVLAASGEKLPFSATLHHYVFVAVGQTYGSA